MELALTPFLRSLVAEHRAPIGQLERQVLRKAVGNKRAHDAGCVFGPQSEGFTASIGKTIHFFADDIGGVTECAAKDVGKFKDGSLNLAESVKSRNFKKALTERAMATTLFR